jgi:glycosyltransferase involved in cell wall biosynthesis
VIVHANSARQQLIHQHHLAPESVHVIPIGVYDYYRAWADDSQAERPNTILFFGRIWKYKGLQYLIEAEPIITRAVPDARIVIAGSGEPFEKYRQAMINPDSFEVHNRHIREREVAGLFQYASVVVLPYLEASQTGVVPIAYAFGKPVVATRVGGIPEVVDHGRTGLLVPPGDPKSLAEAIIALLRNREQRMEMGRKAKEETQNRLSWSSIAERTVGVYEKALASG